MRYERKRMLVEVVRREQRRERVEEVEERLGVGVEVHEHEAAPALDAHRARARGRRASRELVAVDDLDEPAVERVAPRVVRAADRAVGERRRSPRRGACRGAGTRCGSAPIVAGRRPHDEDRLVADRVLDVVAGRGELLLAAGDLPDARPQPLELEVEELARRVALLRDEPVVAHARPER